MVSDSDLFLHSLQQSGLHLCRRAIDLVRHQDVVEYGPAAKVKSLFSWT